MENNIRKISKAHKVWIVSVAGIAIPYCKLLEVNNKILIDWCKLSQVNNEILLRRNYIWCIMASGLAGYYLFCVKLGFFLDHLEVMHYTNYYRCTEVHTEYTILHQITILY